MTENTSNRPPVSDHKPKGPKKGKKAAKVQKGLAQGKAIEVEVNGKAWTVSPSAVDDFELLEDLDAIDSGNVGRIPKVLRRVLGSEQYPAALDSLRGKNGVVSIDAAATFFYKIFEAINPNS